MGVSVNHTDSFRTKAPTLKKFDMDMSCGIQFNEFTNQQNWARGRGELQRFEIQKITFYSL